MSNYLNKTIFIILSGFIILELYFFLPLGPNRLLSDDFNKTFLLWLIIPIAFIVYLVGEFQSGEFKWQKTKLDIPLAIFLGAMAIATIFSQDVFSSFFGARTAISLPLLSIIMLLGLYFLVVQAFRETEQRAILKIIIWTLMSAVLLGLLVIIGTWLELLTETGNINNIFRSALGTLEDLSIYAAIANIVLLSILGSASLKKDLFKKKWQAILLRATWLSTWVLLIIINFVPAWWVLLAGTSIIVVYRKKINGLGTKKQIIKATLVILIPLSFLIADYVVLDPEVRNRRMASRLQLDRENTRLLMQETLKNKPLNGYGLETFSLVFSQNRPTEMNQTPYWYLRFNKGAAFICELFISSGLIGLLSFVFLLVVIIISLIKSFKSSANKDIWLLYSSTLASFMVSFFVFTINLWLIIIFWLFLALFQKSNIHAVPFVVNQKSKAGKFQLTSIIGFTVILGFTILSALSLKYWLAEVYFQNATGTQSQMIKAAQLNPNRGEFHVALAKYYKNQALAQVVNTGSQTALINLGQSVAESKRWAEQAIAVAPNSVVAHESLGMVLRDLAGYFENGEEEAIDSFKRAIALEPSNPVLLTELGVLYLSTEQSELARDTFQLALDLKPSFFNAEYNLAKTYSLRAEYEKAIEILTRLARERKTTELFYELGRAQFNAGDLEGAIDSFNQVIIQDPLHANALYSLGLALAEAGDKDEALYFLNKVLDLNPSNIEVQAKIRVLE